MTENYKKPYREKYPERCRASQEKYRISHPDYSKKSRERHALSIMGVNDINFLTAWKGITQRCYKKDHSNYKYYGSKGITVCDEWLKNPRSFASWLLNNGYSKGMCVHRIDSSLGYSAKNCIVLTKNEHMKVHGKTPLTDQQISEIKNQLQMGVALRKIAQNTGASHQMVFQIKKGICHRSTAATNDAMIAERERKEQKQ